MIVVVVLLVRKAEAEVYTPRRVRTTDQKREAPIPDGGQVSLVSESLYVERE